MTAASSLWFEYKTLHRRRRLKYICLLGMKPVCSGCIISQICFFNLFAMIFPIILVSVGSKEIGLYDDTSSQSRPGLGIRAILASYIDAGKRPASCECLYIRTNNGKITLLNILYNSMLNPSGPGALLLGNSLIAFSTSSIFISASSAFKASSLDFGKCSPSIKLSIFFWPDFLMEV